MNFGCTRSSLSLSVVARNVSASQGNSSTVRKEGKETESFDTLYAVGVSAKESREKVLIGLLLAESVDVMES